MIFFGKMRLLRVLEATEALLACAQEGWRVALAQRDRAERALAEARECSRNDFRIRKATEEELVEVRAERNRAYADIDTLRATLADAQLRINDLMNQAVDSRATLARVGRSSEVWEQTARQMEVNYETFKGLSERLTAERDGLRATKTPQQIIREAGEDA